MKRSAQVSAPLLAAVALAISTGCRNPQMQRCVDEQNHVVPDSFCQNPQQQRNSYGYVPMYRYYYGGTGSYNVGSAVSGGSYTAVSGASYATSTSRGGFGSSFGGGHSSSGGGGDAGGAGS
jgi:hypothetical protein